MPIVRQRSRRTWPRSCPVTMGVGRTTDIGGHGRLLERLTAAAVAGDTWPPPRRRRPEARSPWRARSLPQAVQDAEDHRTSMGLGTASDQSAAATTATRTGARPASGCSGATSGAPTRADDEACERVGTATATHPNAAVVLAGQPRRAAACPADTGRSCARDSRGRTSTRRRMLLRHPIQGRSAPHSPTSLCLCVTPSATAP